MHMPEYRKTEKIIPYGAPQFFDFAINIDDVAKMKQTFWEETLPPKDGEAQMRLHTTYVDEESGEIFDSETRTRLKRDSYDLTVGKDLRHWYGQWLPLPFFRHSGQHRREDNTPIFERGPTNWARGRITPDPECPNERLRLTLIFDMQVEEPESGGDDGEQHKTYALSRDDVAAGAVFSLAAATRDNAWFLNEGWVDGWLREIWDNWNKSGRNKNRSLEDWHLVYLASYLLLVGLMEKALGGMQLQLINPDSSNFVDVDLILDIGNSRTTGMLVETQTQRSTNLNDSYPLQLRDMECPETAYADPFETRVEFSEVNFGLEAYSRRSGRKTTAFAWISPVRTGPEAARLASMSACAEGTTGMSSPKRYLWDERDWQASWRYNAKKSGEREIMVTRGVLPALLNDSGTPLVCMDDRRFAPLRKAGQGEEILFESKFTRSSIMMFLFVEILQQALVTINSPAQRGRQDKPDLPRRLRRVLFTVPAGMPIAEQRIYRRWAEWAVRTFWQAMGWEDFYVRQGRQAERQDFRNSPQVHCKWDEATCTQLVYVYNEIKHNYQDDAHLFFSQMGRRLEKYGNKPCLRLASIDLGGGTSDLSITTYVLESDRSATNRVAPRLEIRDGFNLAGDDVLKNIVRDLVMDCIAQSMEQQGVGAASTLTQEIFGKSLPNSSKREQNMRAQFVRQVAIPVALAMLSFYERKNMHNMDGNISFALRDIFVQPEEDRREGAGQPEMPFARFPAPHAQVLDYPQKAVRDRRGVEFSVMDVNIDVPCDRLDACIDSTLRDSLRNMCELVHRHECDVLLLTGRPSCWNAVVRNVFSHLPVAPDRILPMRDYSVGSWYPFADTFGHITDPKTTVVVGSILCVLAENSLEGFAFDPNELFIGSTARYVGELDPATGTLPREKVWFTVDLRGNEAVEMVREGEQAIEFSTPIVIGFRQLEVPRWTATRCYRMEFANEKALQASQGETPYKVELALHLDEVDEDKPVDEARAEGDITVTSITNRSGNGVNTKDLTILLRTLKKEEDEGCWLDTGILY